MNKFMILMTLLVLLLTSACVPSQPGEVQPVTPTLEPISAGSSAILMYYEPVSLEINMAAIHLHNGQPVEEIPPVKLGSQASHSFSPNRDSLAVVAQSADCPVGCLRLFRLADLVETARIELPAVEGSDEWFHQVLFSPNGDTAAVLFHDSASSNASLALFDLSADPPRLAGQVKLSLFARLAAFSGDGRRIMLVGLAMDERGWQTAQEDPLPRALLLDLQTLQPVWQQDLPEYKDGFYGSGDYAKPNENYAYTPALVADPASDRFLVTHAEANRLTIIDFQNQVVETVDIRPPQSQLMRLLERILSIGARPVQAKAANSSFRQARLSADGRTLFVVGARSSMTETKEGQWDHSYTPLGLEVWDISTRTVLNKVDTLATEIRIGPGGLILLNGFDYESSTYQPVTDIYDPASAQVSSRLVDTYAYPSLTTGGLPVLVSAYTAEHQITKLAFLDQAALATRHAWIWEGGPAYWMEWR